MSELIPTLSKSKLAEGWSYPVGAENLTAHLPMPAEFNYLGIYFHGNKNPFKAASMIDPRFRLVTICCSDSAFDAIEGKKNWTILLCCVPGTYRSIIRQIIIEQVLPRASDWMLERHLSHHGMRRPTFEAQYDVDKAEVFILDTVE